MQYKDCEKCYHRLVCAGDTDKWNYYGECPHYISATDVVPKSEVDNLIKVIDNTTQQFLELHDLYQNAKSDVAREIFEEIGDNAFVYGVNLVISTKTLAELKKKYVVETPIVRDLAEEAVDRDITNKQNEE